MMNNSYCGRGDAVRRLRAMRRPFAFVVALLVALSIIPAIGAGAPGATPGEVYADSIELYVYSQLGASGTPEIVKAYTKLELDDVASSPAITTMGYISHSGNNWQVYGTNKYITIADLLKDSGVKTGTSTGALGKGYAMKLASDTTSAAFGYNKVNSVDNGRGYFYPDTTSASAVTQGAVSMPAILSIDNSGPVDIGAGATAGGVLSGLTGTAITTKSGINQFLYGLTEKEYTNPGPVKFISNVKSITIIEPALDVWLKDGSLNVKLKTYSLDRLASMAAVYSGNPRGFLQKQGNNWSVHVANEYVPFTDILADNNIALSDVVSIKSAATVFDSFTSPYDANSLASQRYFYPGCTGSSSENASGPRDVGAVIALQWESERISSTAASTLADIVSGGAWVNGLRSYIGLSESNYKSGTAPGNRFATDPDSFIIELDTAGKIDGIKKEMDAISNQLKDVTATNSALAGNKAALEGQLAALEAQKAALQVQLDTVNFKNVSAKISKLSAGKKSAAVTWKKIGKAEGYQVVYAASKSFKGKKTVTIKKAATVKATVKKLKKGKTYFFKVRGYAKIGGKTVYTKYSPVRKIKITK
jgi:hypothetical protein